MEKQGQEESKTGLSRRGFIKAAGAIGGIALAGKAVAGSAAPVEVSAADQTPVASVPARLAIQVEDNPLAGAFDMHVHSAPDITRRALNDFQLAQSYRDAGLRGFLLIHHQTMTLDRAYMVRQVVPGIEVFGGVALNYPTGGLNAATVDTAIKFSGGCMASVKLPSQSAGRDMAVKANKPDAYGEGPGLWVIDKNGNLVPEMGPILKSIAKADLIMLTGHLSPKEDLVVVKAAKEAGVKRIVITHAMSPTEGLTIEQQKQLADMGAFVEHIALNYFNEDVTIDQFVAAIKAVGAKRCIISTDLGQALNPVPAEGLREFVTQLMAKGITKEEMDWMIRKNPAMLLGLEPFQPPAA